MVSQQEGIFSISNRLLILRGLVFLLLLSVATFIPFMIATVGKLYPDLSTAPILSLTVCFILVPLSAEYWRQTTVVHLKADQFIIRKWAQKPRLFAYNAILAYNERRDFGKGDAFNVLTVYLEDDYFILKSNEFEAYDLLKNTLCQYAQPVSYQKVMTLAERNRLRWMIGGLASLIIANIVFGYVAHNPVEKKSARLTAFTGLVHKVFDDRPKSILKGVVILLSEYPDFSFYVSRRNFDIRLDTLRSAIMAQQPITLVIRESEYRKKLLKTEPLTFGDKYVDYSYVMVYGLSQGNGLRLQTSASVKEPTHTNPIQRTLLLSMLLLICWAGWVYIDRHNVLRHKLAG